MYNTCVSSAYPVSLKCKMCASFSFNGNAYCMQDKFNKYPLFNSSSCCCCCANSSMYRVPLCPSYVSGLRQSTLIQWAPCKRVILRSLDRCSTDFPVFGIERKIYYEKSCSFDNRRRGRFGCVGFQEKKKERNSLRDVDEAEALLSLLSEDVDEPCVDLSRKKMGVEIKENDVENKKNRGRTVAGRKPKYEVESMACVSTKENKIRNEQWRREEEDALLRGEEKQQRNAREVVGVNLDKKIRGTRAREEDKEPLLSGESQKASVKREYLLRKSNIERARKEERECLSRKSNIERVRKEEREDLSRREDQKQKVRKEGSSGSSYYSLSSTGELESDNEMQIEHEIIHGELSNKNEKHSKSEEFAHYGRVEEQVGRHEDYSREQGVILSKQDTSMESYVASADIERDWRKKSEKKLTDVLIEENETRKELSQKQSTISGVHESSYGKEISSYEAYDDKKHKQFFDMPVNRDPTETMTKMEKKTDIIHREDESRKHSQKIRKSQIQEVDVRGTFTKESERKKSSEVSSSRGRSHADVTDEQQHKTSREKSQTLSTYVSERQSNTRLTNREEYKTHFHKSSLASRGQSSKPSGEEGTEQTTSLMREKDPLMACQNDANVVNKDGMSQRKSQAYSSSQLLSSSSRVEFAAQRFSPASAQSGSSVPMEHSPDRPHLLQQETYGEVRRGEISEEPLEYIGEFVEKVRHEVSSSEIEKEKRSLETKSVYEGEQDNQTLLGQNERGESQSKKQDSTSSSLGSGAVGPSDEMWVTQPLSIQETPPSIQETSLSTQETPGTTELKDDAQIVGSHVIKRPSQSMWHIVADIVRLRWISHSGKHTSSLGSGGMSSSHQSTTSEAQISKPGESVKKGKSLLSKSSSDQNKMESTQIQSEGEVSNSSNSRDQIKLEWEDAPSHISPSKSVSLASNEETLQKTIEGPSTGTVITELPSPSPSSSGTEQVVPSASTEISISHVKDGEVRQRRFQRANQVMKDRFDEWEEAYRIDAEQRKADEMFMREALLEAKKAASNWEVPVGAVLVKGGKIIARGCNLVEEMRDSTAHAEMICIREASNVLRSWRLSETTLYVTLEPCPMCAGAILQARIDTVVWGAPNKLLGADGSWIRLFPDGDEQRSLDKPPAPVHPFHPKMTIRRGVLGTECADAMQQFFQLRRKKEKKSDPPPSQHPISSHPNKFLSKMHDAFHLMFCL